MVSFLSGASLISLGAIALVMQGCGEKGGGSSPAACKAMTDTDPCFKKCGPGNGCTYAICGAMGKIGCTKESCVLMGENGTNTSHCMSGQCKSMTDSDPCFQLCHTGMNCTSEVCSALGKIGCDGAQCSLMGKNGSNTSHCMSPGSSAACESMTDTDPCFQKCHSGMNCTSSICQALGKIGCNAAQCSLMGESGTSTAMCMSPMMASLVAV